MPGQDFDPGLIEALKERHQQQMIEAIERHQQTHGELEESLAQIIYEQAIIPAARHCRTEAPKWVAGGNSIAQDDARVAARAIIRRWPREEQGIAENIQRRLLRRIDMVDKLMAARARLKEQEPIVSVDATASCETRLAQQVKLKMLEGLDRSCDTTAAEIIEQIADWIAQTLRSEARR